MTTLLKNEHILREAKGGHVPPVPPPPGSPVGIVVEETASKDQAFSLRESIRSSLDHALGLERGAKRGRCF